MPSDKVTIFICCGKFHQKMISSKVCELTLKIKMPDNDDFVITGGTTDCHYDNLRCCQCWISWRYENTWFSVHDMLVWILKIWCKFCSKSQGLSRYLQNNDLSYFGLLCYNSNYMTVPVSVSYRTVPVPAPYKIVPVPYQIVPVPMPYTTVLVPYKIVPMPYKIFPVPYKIFPVPYMIVPVPYKIVPVPY